MPALLVYWVYRTPAGDRLVAAQQTSSTMGHKHWKVADKLPLPPGGLQP